jgi:hypothetical protein
MNIFNWARWKLLLLSALGLLILALSMWQSESAVSAEKRMYLGNPQKFLGKEICASYIKIDETSPGSAVGRDKSGNVYRFQINSSDILVNERYSFKGTLKSDGMIQVSSFQYHPHRLLKYAFSALSLVIVLYLIIMHIRIERSSLLLSVSDLHKGLFGIKRGIDFNA